MVGPYMKHILSVPRIENIEITQHFQNHPSGLPAFSNLSLWEARLGKFDPAPEAKTEPTQQNIKLNNIFTPPGFDVNNPLLPGKDLVLLKLERPVTMNTWTRPLCLPNNDDIPSTGQKCVITGWGSITRACFIMVKKHV